MINICWLVCLPTFVVVGFRFGARYGIGYALLGAAMGAIIGVVATPILLLCIIAIVHILGMLVALFHRDKKL
jgi:hypothetical protein